MMFCFRVGGTEATDILPKYIMAARSSGFNPETDVQLDTSPILKSLMNKRETYVQEGLSRITKQYQVRSAIALDEFAAHGSARAQHALEEVRSIGSAASKSAVRQALESKSLRSRQKQ